MGLRGPGAGRMKAAQAALPTKPRALPWKKKDLTRAQYWAEAQ